MTAKRKYKQNIKLNITQKRKIIGTILLLLASIQIINFAIRDIHIKPVVYYKTSSIELKGINSVLVSTINYPVKILNFYIYRMLGWSGLLTPFFLIIFGFTFFKRRTEKSHRLRIKLLWGLAELMFLIYVINYFSFLALPKSIRPGFVSEIFSKYLQKIGGAGFILIFFAWSLIGYFLYIQESNWHSFYKSMKQLLIKGLLTISNIFSEIFQKAEKKKKVKQNPKTIQSKTEKKQISSKSETIIEDYFPTYDDNIIKTESDLPKKTSITFNASINTLSSFNFSALNETENSTVSQDEIDNLCNEVNDILKSFGFNLKQSGVTCGLRIIRIDYKMPRGVKIKNIEKYQEEISYRLGGLKISFSINSAETFGINIPRRNPDTPGLGSYICDSISRPENVPIIAGVDQDGNPVWTDGHKFPHLLIAGATGSGKSVFLNALILSLTAASTKSPISLLLIDPKRVEFSLYNSLSIMGYPVITDPVESINILEKLVDTMEERYAILENNSLRNITEYNENEIDKLSFIFVIIDEFSDLLLQDETGELKKLIIRLAQKSRAVGIHIILATQRPSSNIIDGLIKANFPARIAFKTSSTIDSRIILDEGGAEALLGNGDMLFKNVQGEISRLQGIYVSTEEIKHFVGGI